MKEGDVWVLKVRVCVSADHLLHHNFMPVQASMVNQAGQVHIFRSLDTLRAVIDANEEIREWVIQRYL